MKKIAIIAGLITEVILFLAAAFLLVSGLTDGICAAIPFGPVSAAAIAIASLAGWLLFLRTDPKWARVLSPACGLALTTMIAAHAAVAGAESLIHSPWIFLYYAVSAACAFSANGWTWLLPAGCMIGIELLCSLFPAGKRAAIPMADLLPLSGYLLSAGVVPFLIGQQLLRKKNNQLISSGQAQIAVAPEHPSKAEADSKWLMHTSQSAETALYTRDQLLSTRVEDGQDVEGILASVVFFMRRNFVAYSALGFIFQPQRQTLVLNSFHTKSITVIKDIEIALGRGVVGKTGLEKKTFASGDLAMYSEEVHYYSGNEGVNSILASPILSEDKELLGVLVIDSKEKRAFTDDHRETLKRFSSLAAALITNARMRIYQQKVARNFQIFYETSHKFTTALKPEEVLEILLHETSQLTRFTRLMLITVNYQKKAGQIYRLVGTSPDLQEGIEFPLTGGIYAYALQNRQTVTIGDLLQPENAAFYRFAPNEPRYQELRSIIALPILGEEERGIGLLSVESDIPNQFNGEFEQIASTLVENASVAITRALLYQRMERLASTDGLTGLNNHRSFQEQLAMEHERSRRYSRSFGLLLMDIDHFKSFNDTYGHPVGDLVLKEIASCIRKSIRVNDIPARYGGEEFTVILPESGEQGTLTTAERIRRTVELCVIRSGNQDLRVSISIGCACFPTQTQDKSELIKCADTALYYSKEHGRNRITLYQKGMVQKGK
jgi:diguanylate cyclase (GGDEF)-like protein